MLQLKQIISFILFLSSIEGSSLHVVDLGQDILNPRYSFESLGEHIAISVNKRSQTAEELEEKSGPSVGDLNPRLVLMFHAVNSWSSNCPGILQSLLTTGVFENIHVRGKTGGSCTVDQREEIDEQLSGFRFGDDIQKKNPSFQRLAAEVKPKSTGLFFAENADIKQPFVPLHYGRGIATFNSHILARASHSPMDTAAGIDFVVLEGFRSRYDRLNVPYEVLVWGPLSLVDVDKFYFESEEWQKIDSATKAALVASGIETLCYTFGQAQADVYFRSQPEEVGIHWDHEWAEAIRNAQVIYEPNIKKRSRWNAEFKMRYENWRLDLIAKTQSELAQDNQQDDLGK